MAKTWYPVVDYTLCTECGACISKCSHGVYDEEKAPAPVVKDPVACIDHCHGCGAICPEGAITYVGENTDQTPPHMEQKKEENCCSFGCGDEIKNKVIVDYLYLDLESCDRCIRTDNILDEVMTTLTPAFELAGFIVEYNKLEMYTEEIAAQYMFLSSPTIRVNGQDICQLVEENSCGCCSDISGTDVNCRVFEYNEEIYDVPPKEMLARSILNAVFGKVEPGCSCSEYKLPENLRGFFEGKDNRSGCSCQRSY